MCGILGYISFDREPPPRKQLQACLDLLRHRGPDSSGIWEEEGVWLGHRRLSILDLSDRGNQPMISPEGRYIIVFNGEFYNYREYVPFLEKKGYLLQSTGDTAVLVGLYSFLGENMLDHINGMFALAIWDTQEQCLFLARDRLGKKPLYYHLNDRHIIFASEMKALVPLLETRTLDGEAVDAYFSFGYIPSPLSIYREVRKLEAATYIEIKRGLHRKNRYWSLQPPTNQNVSDDEIQAALEKSINLRFVADVPVGVLLSGGIDSSLITALAAGRLRKNFQTFCVAGGEADFDERPFAHIVAERYGIELLTDSIASGDVWRQIERIIPFIDEPFADSSILPTYLVTHLTSRHVKVVLSGEGGDEVFGGYDKYARWLKVRAFRKVPWPIRRVLRCFESGINEYQRSFWRSLIKLNRHSFAGDVETFCAFNSLMSPFFKRKLFAKAFSDQFWSENIQYFQSLDDGMFQPYTLKKMMSIDRRTYLAEDLMFKADRMSMANSLEVRCPFLDYQLVELSLRVPEKDMMNLNRSKILLRRIAKRWLPETVTERPKKGFSIPINEWFRGRLVPLFKEYVKKDEVLGEIFDYEEIERRFTMHCSGQYNFGGQLWAILMFHLWWQFHGRGTTLFNTME
jgi:asparagine synthase (glutamine-hydrolysing)